MVKPSGFILDGGNNEVAQTLRCCHCGYQWVRVVGSGKVRGFCVKCSNVTCGAPRCDNHAPLEAVLDFNDGGGSDKSLPEIQKKLMQKYPGIDKIILS